MSRGSPLRATRDGRFVISGLGGLYVTLAVGRAMFVAVGANKAPAEVLINFALVAAPGVGLLYGGYWLSGSDISPDVYPRIAGWCLGGCALLLGIVGLLVLNPQVTVDHLFWAATLATALGAVGGFGIGTKEGQAITRAYEAERQKRALQRQNDRLESFASMLAHELRNPLEIAQIYLQQAAEGDREAAAEVEAALDRIEEMIDVLLITARATDVNVERETVSIRTVAASAWADSAPETATLVVEADRSIRMDPVHLRHLFENLFRNALTHGDSGVTVRVGDLPAGFYVEDDGPGVPESERDDVFEAGYTTDASGIGLGLTFVSQLVETYGWECELTESEFGGARFEFTGANAAPRNGQ